MEMNPQRVRSAEFRTVRKGVDADEVRIFLNDVADELERAQNQSTAMEARARAAVARLQELNESAATNPPVATVDASAEESETISRTLLLAQRTADQTIAEARAQAATVVAAADEQAATTLDSTREMSAQLVAEARADARKSGEAERLSISGEVDALKARRDFLESDVHHLETFLVDQRSRMREAATALTDIAERVPGGLGDVRAPLLSASDDDAPADVDVDDDFDNGAHVDEPTETADELVILTDITDRDEGTVDSPPTAVTDAVWSDDVVASGDPTEAISVFRLDDDDDASPDEHVEEFTFSFDDERP